MKQLSRTPTKVYLSGPMRGVVDHNFAAFESATQWLRDQGYEVWNPHEHEKSMPTHGDKEFSEMMWLRDTFRQDFDAVFDCDTIALLPGWTYSEGSIGEFQAAKLAKLNLYRLIQLGDSWAMRFMRPQDYVVSVAWIEHLGEDHVSVRT